MTARLGAAARHLVRRVVRIPADVVVLLLRLWQLVVSPVYGQTCRFYPSCADYMSEAIRAHGAAKGIWLGTRRLARCHPLGNHGVDPVPPS